MSTAKRTLFLVDDDDANRLTLSVLLEDENFEVLVAASFQEASARLEEFGRCAAALLDQRLGDGEGLGLVPLIRRAAPQAKLLLLTGNPEALSHAAVASVDAVLPKGLMLQELISRLEQVLQSRPE